MLSLPRLARLALLAALAGPAFAAPAPARRPMVVDALWSFEQVGRPVLSPDGRLAAFSVAVPSLETNQANSDLWIVPTDGGGPPRRLTWNEGPDGSPTWSPDGRRIAFTSKRKEEHGQLYVLSLDGGEAEQVTAEPLDVGNLVVARSGEFLACTMEVFPGSTPAETAAPIVEINIAFRPPILSVIGPFRMNASA